VANSETRGQMRLFSNTFAARTVLCALFLTGAFGPAFEVGAQERKSINEHDVWKHRPANMFKMSENKDPSVCRAVQRS